MDSFESKERKKLQQEESYKQKQKDVYTIQSDLLKKMSEQEKEQFILYCESYNALYGQLLDEVYKNGVADGRYVDII